MPVEFASPFPVASGSSGMPNLTPREKMRLAKLALIRDESQEVTAVKERRASKRAGGLALELYDRQGAEMMRSSSEQGLSSGARVDSIPGGSGSSSPSDSFHRPQSILRKPSLTPSDSASLPARSPLRAQIPSADEFGVSVRYTDGPSPKSSISEHPPAPRRRSSRVRFSEELLPSANSSPALPVSMARENSVEAMPPLPAVKVIPSPSAMSFAAASILGSGAMSISSTNFVVKRAKQLPRISTTSRSQKKDTAENALRRPSSSRKSSSTSVVSLASEQGDLAGTSRLDSGLEDMFKPQPLPYTKLDKVMARLSSESGASSLSSSIRGSASSSGTTESDAQVVPASLRNAIDRQSLSMITPPRPLVTLYDRSPSSQSSISAASPSPDRATCSTPGSLRSSAISTSFTSVGEFLAQSKFSVSSGSSLPSSLSSSISPLALVSHFETYFGVTHDAAPKINRLSWHDPDAGLSPRSMPTPIAPCAGTIDVPLAIPDAIEEEEPARPESSLWPYSEMIPSSRPSDADSIDMLPILDRRSTSASLPPPPASEGKHKRNDSGFSIDLGFPLPPQRLTFALNRVTSTKKRLSITDAPLMLAVETTAEHGVIEEDDGAEAGDEQEIEPEIEEMEMEMEEETPAPRQQAEMTVPLSVTTSPVSTKTASMPSTPSPDVASSLTMAVRQVGQPLPLTSRFSIDSNSTGSVHTRRRSSEGQGSSRRYSKPSSGERPPSPDVGHVMSATLETLRRRKSSFHPYAKFDESDSDIDLEAPLEQAALKSKILSPNSRLLASAKNRAPSRHSSTISSTSLRSGLGLTSGKGWSGSESEEEEWQSSVRLSSIRRMRQPLRPINSDTARLQRPAWAKQTDRLSQASQISTLSSLTADSDASALSTDLLTPSGSMDKPYDDDVVAVDPSSRPHLKSHRRTSSMASTSASSAATVPGNFAWGKASPEPSCSPSPSPSSSPTKSSALQLKRRSSARTVGSDGTGAFSNLPTPTRQVDGWGLPEKMMDESEDETPRVAYTSWLPKLAFPLSRTSSGLSSPADESPASAPASSSYYFERTAAIEDRLAGLFGRSPLPLTRNVSDPIPSGGEAKVEKGLAAVQSSFIPRLQAPSRPRTAPLPIAKVVKDDPQCAACRFF